MDRFSVLANSYDHKVEYELVESLDPEGPVVADGTLTDLEFGGDEEDLIKFKFEFRDRGDPRVLVYWDKYITVVKHPKAAFGLLYL